MYFDVFVYFLFFYVQRSNNKIQSTHNPESWSLCVWMCECRMYPLSLSPSYFTHHNITTHENVINKAGHYWTETCVIVRYIDNLQFFVSSLMSTKWAPLPFLCQTECNNQPMPGYLFWTTVLVSPSVLYRPGIGPGPGISGYIQLAPVHSGSGSVLAPELFMFQPKCFPSLPARLCFRHQMCYQRVFT